MKISGDVPIPELNPQDSQVGETKGSSPTQPAQPTQPAEAPNRDPVNLSGRAQELLDLQRQAQSVPEASSDRVAAIRKAMEAGTFSASADEVAQSILNGVDADKIL